MAPIKAFLFDVFGTVVDWRSSVVAELETLGKEHGQSADWGKFAQEWRNGYLKTTRLIAEGTAAGPLNVDAMHKKILDSLLSEQEWAHLGSAWDEKTRQHLNLVWHRLNAWPDSVEGLQALKKHAIIATLSNGNVRLLIDMAKHAGLPWDTIFSTELFNTFKPNPRAYTEAMRHLSLPPENCAMVAAHIYDLRAAASQGMLTVYVPRLGEDAPELQKEVKAKADGGDVDYVLSSFAELAGLAAGGD
ncbi:haloacid dehalogenase [Pholiota conissans]|uniref:Haloacid dehalogenase n=1 Tax=Pholiota conissans TaxID=109636 RepID=A0A9P5Z1Y7_9AGAR|nr:haloacid dehalogenase [Pholiota conissans]